ncbi:Bug family tripartite tricarboxylate transporter substrate binding protein [Polynucleobacter kasalickyi]|uniref:Tripartite-type tricarboxylate transporter, receptor component TctC n=1 Tax=Polynucleobacter kasalickyi TaxID=1938817 RepID=A0A1W1YM36_9BURK|nr:tripartite tricarboxylate transporter substrate binding protein [Polynucleobacter kasalickyi]SMC37192.1 Tripartite-type tricarboxylate transporter, receptor component TctC [Polynucleobacter kasalickyi]
MISINKIYKFLNTLGVVGSAVAVVSFSSGLLATEKYPQKPVRIVVGFSAGGPVDNISRIISKRLSEKLGQPFVVDNKPGASSMIAAQFVANSEPDGHTLLMVASTHAINPSLYKNIAFDTSKDFTAIGFVAENAFVLVVPKDLKVNTLADLIGLAKNQSSPLNYASAGVGGLPHLAGELFKLEAGIDTNHIPYKGASPASVDLLAGHVSFMINNMQSALPYIKDGRLKALASTSSERISALPAVPTFKELGFKSLQFTGWYGLLGPAGMSPDLVKQLNVQISQILREKEVVAQIRADGAEVKVGSPKEFSERIHSDMMKWSEVIKRADIKGQ